jgi:hypothetical protein
MAVPLALSLAGLLLLFVAPGLGLSAALFPEKVRPARDRGRAWLELAALSVIVSLAVTVLLGEFLQASSLGFSASWSDPGLELLDGAVALAGLVVAIVRGAFGSTPLPEPPNDPDAGGWPALRSFEGLAREERRIERELAAPGLASDRRRELEARREELRAERESLRRRREAEFAA